MIAKIAEIEEQDLPRIYADERGSEEIAKIAMIAKIAEIERAYVGFASSITDCAPFPPLPPFLCVSKVFGFQFWQFRVPGEPAFGLQGWISGDIGNFGNLSIRRSPERVRLPER